MTPPKTRPASDIPDALFQECNQHLGNYTVGLVRVEGLGRIKDAVLLGSGVLVKVGDVRTILTADHVLDILPRSGRLGLVLSHKLEQVTVDVDGIEYLSIDRGNIPEQGPDIGAILLSPTVASTLGARKSFYNLD